MDRKRFHSLEYNNGLWGSRMRLFFLLLFLCLMPGTLAFDTGNDVYGCQNFFGSGGVGEEGLTTMNVSTSHGQASVGNVSSSVFGTYIGFQYVASDWGFSTPYVAPVAFILQVFDFGMEWVKLSWR